MKERYIDRIYYKKPTVQIMNDMNEIIEAYLADGYVLTVRQLYYQLVAAAKIPNDKASYKRVVEHLSQGRLAGLIDWAGIEDRSRGLKDESHWDSPASIMKSAAKSFQLDKWSLANGQTYRPEIWVEKDALGNVIARSCEKYGVPWFSCRGYTSLSEVRHAAQRAMYWMNEGQKPFIIHLGDHDPSGKDMTRDILDRFRMFAGQDIPVRRIALNWHQIKRYSPPPNFAKEADSRYPKYVAEFGEECFELDALKPQVITNLIHKEVEKLLDADAWEKACAREEHERKALTLASEKWPAVAKFVTKPPRKRRTRKPSRKIAAKKRAAKKGITKNGKKTAKR
jgi:hypothetical protein